METAKTLGSAGTLAVHRGLAVSKRGWGLGMKDRHHNSPRSAALTAKVPLVGYAACGIWREAVDNFKPGDAERRMHATVPVKRHTYALRVEGDSMEPRFPSGAVLTVDPEAEAKSGSFVIVRQNGAETAFRQLVIEGGMSYLKPLNHKYPAMPLAEDAVICGVVRQIILDVQ